MLKSTFKSKSVLKAVAHRITEIGLLVLLKDRWSRAEEIRKFVELVVCVTEHQIGSLYVTVSVNARAYGTLIGKYESIHQHESYFLYPIATAIRSKLAQYKGHIS